MITASVRADVNFYNVGYLGGITSVVLPQEDTPDLTALDSTQFASTCKISHHTNVKGADLKIAQANENSVDIDVSTDVNISGDFGLPDKNGKIGRADQVITIKGGSSAISISGIIHCQPTRGKSHVVVGEWMDQSYAMSSDVHLNLKQEDGSPINYTTGWVKPFSVKANGAKWMMWESIGLKIYWIAKYIVRLVLRIPQGTKGPSWM